MMELTTEELKDIHGALQGEIESGTHINRVRYLLRLMDKIDDIVKDQSKGGGLTFEG
jgi:hypothetical protein